MRFVVEALGLTSAGGKELALNLLRMLPKCARHEFILLVPDLPEYLALGGTNLRRIPYVKPESLLRRYLFLHRTVPKVCSEQRADALLCMGNFPPRNHPCPTVVLFNHPYLVYQEPSIESRLTLRERLIVTYGRHACRRHLARLPLIVHTRFVQERLVRIYGLDPRRIAVIPGACPFPVAGAAASNGSRKKTLRPFTFLTISRYMPHKNFEVLLEAMRRLPSYTRWPARCQFNVSADQHPGARRLLRQIEEAGPEGGVENLGWLPTREALEEAYRSADAYILPSLMETFSFTYLEAMRFGLPVLTSDRDFARDRCQDAALYFDPLNADDVAKCMATIIEDDGMRHKLVEKGKLLLDQTPTWDDVAARIVAVLERVASGLEPYQDLLGEEGSLAQTMPSAGHVAMS
jgi:glycosyltransferase involved in cell wall biosynthesis